MAGWSTGVALSGAAGWGVASILLSPCHLASIPLIVGYMGGEERIEARRAVLVSFAFAGGMLLTIALVGGVATLVGLALGGIGTLLAYVMAAVFLVVGLEFLGVFEFSWRVPAVPSWLGRGPLGALLLGLLFGLALGPCTLAFLAPVLTDRLGGGLVESLAGERTHAGLRAWSLRSDRRCRELAWRGPGGFGVEQTVPGADPVSEGYRGASDRRGDLSPL